jgi:Virulence-associated protein E/Bifunctional DNA primase/polymerase, N-terminal/Primase C terminal 2 (PriCT-2)
MSSLMLDMALAYARKGWRVFPLHSIRDGHCTCQKRCTSPGKHPRTRGGFKDATTEPAPITAWWNRWSDANIGIATGSGLAVIDVDGPEGFQEFGQLVRGNEPIPETLVSKTGNGYHFIFSTREGGPEVRNSARGNVHVRGEGGYIVAPPSNHHSGKQYQWVKQAKLAVLPDWLRQWTQGYEISARASSQITLRNLPAHLAKYNQRDTAKRLDEALATVWSPNEQARLESALQAIDVKACGYEDFLNIGFALQSLNWDRSDGTSLGFDIWNRWCAQSEHHNQAGLEDKWKSFGKRSGVTLGSVYHLANQHGWNGGAPPSAFVEPPAKPMNGTHYALPAELTAPQPIHFPDVTEEGKPRATMTNSKVAVLNLGINCSFDQFHNRYLLNGTMLQDYGIDRLADKAVTMIRDAIRFRYAFDPKKENVQDACETLCLSHCFDPVLDYLDTLTWDGTPRLGKWLSTYLGAEHTPFNSHAGSLVLIAAVRRAREPGTKFDQILVLESKEGLGKSTAIEILAGPGNFSDQRILDADERKQQELLEGVWLYEIGDLTGMKRAEVEHVKAFASRTEDRARPAYGRYLETRKRRCVFIGTTNQDQYLISDTGNRRFWPVKTGRIDLEALKRDRDQLWAEAATCEARGISIVLPEKLWGHATEEQEKRKQLDAWIEPIHNYIELKGISETTVLDVLVHNPNLQLTTAQVGYRETLRAVGVLRHLGFTRYQKREDGKRIWKYRRSGQGSEQAGAGSTNQDATTCA